MNSFFQIIVVTFLSVLQNTTPNESIVVIGCPFQYLPKPLQHCTCPTDTSVECRTSAKVSIADIHNTFILISDKKAKEDLKQFTSVVVVDESQFPDDVTTEATDGTSELTSFEMSDGDTTSTTSTTASTTFSTTFSTTTTSSTTSTTTSTTSSTIFSTAGTTTSTTSSTTSSTIFSTTTTSTTSTTPTTCHPKSSTKRHRRLTRHHHLSHRSLERTYHEMETTNLFENFKFKEIKFLVPLNKIPNHFFIGCSQTTTDMTIFDFGQILPETWYHGFSHFPKLERLRFRHTGPHEIISNAFKSLVNAKLKIKELTFEATREDWKGDPLVVRRDAFADLDFIEQIDFQSHHEDGSATYLEPFGFRLKDRVTSHDLLIRLRLPLKAKDEMGTPLINEESLMGLESVDNVVIEIFNRNYEPNDEVDFFLRPFLAENEMHKVIFVHPVKADSSSCDVGIFRRGFRTFIYNQQIFGFCKDDTNMSFLEYFQYNCV